MAHTKIAIALSLLITGCGTTEFSSNRIEAAPTSESSDADSSSDSDQNSAVSVQAGFLDLKKETPVAPVPSVPPLEEACVRGKGLTIAYNQATDTYYEATGDFHVGYNDLLDDSQFPRSAFVADRSVDGQPFLTAFVDGNIDVTNIAHAGLKGLNANASITNLKHNSHVHLFAPLRVSDIYDIGHLSVYGNVALGSIDCVSHLYIEHSNMAQFIGKKLYTSWVHIKR
jgi:hypothetical protein